MDFKSNCELSSSDYLSPPKRIIIQIEKIQRIIRIKPSTLVTKPSRETNKTIIRITISEAPTIAKGLGISLQKVQKKGIKPNIRRSCEFADPMLFPIAIPPWLINDEYTPLTISGRSEPIDETMKPIKNVEIPMYRANIMSFSTKISLEK